MRLHTATSHLYRIVPNIKRTLFNGRVAVLSVLVVSAFIAPFNLSGTASDVSAAEQPIQLGIWQSPAPGDFRPLDRIVSDIGRDVDIIPWYQAWDSPTNSAFKSDKIAYVQRRGAIPMITWEPWNTSKGVNQPQFALKQITNGRHDSYIRTWARAAREAGGTIYIRFAHEMNGNWYPWAVGVNGNSANDYVDAWSHIHDIFDDEGASNVQWVWSPNRDYPGATPLQSVFPGDNQVNLIAMDGYNFGTEKSDTSWRSFNATFQGTYDIVTGLSQRPVIIGETGSSESGGDKAAWIRDGLNPANLAQHFPRLKAVIWFNQVGSGNWPLETSASAMQAFTDVVNSWQTPAQYATSDNDPGAGETVINQLLEGLQRFLRPITP